MKINKLLLIGAWALSLGVLSAQEETPPQPPAADPVLTEKDEESIYEATDMVDATDYVLSAALACEPKILLSFPKKASLSDAKKLATVLADHRLAFYYTYNAYKKGKLNVVELNPKYTSCVRMIRYLHAPDSVKLRPKEKTALEKAREVLRTLDLEGRSNKAKAALIHDWIVENCAYDMPGLRRGFSHYKNTERYSPYDGKYMILENKGVCDSYSQAYWLMLQMADVPSCMIFGTTKRGKHCWNLVYMDDHWGHVDTTWDDPIPDQPGRVLHRYFDLEDKEISKDHKWKKNFFSSDHQVLKYEEVSEFIAFLKKQRKKSPSYTVIVAEAPDSEKFMELAEEEAKEVGIREKLTASPDVIFPNALRIRIQKGKR